MILPGRIFVDTSFFIALLNSRDADHAVAILLQEHTVKQQTHKITSEYVLLELCDGLAKLRHRNLAVQIIHLLNGDNLFEIVRTSHEIWRKAWNLYMARADKEWGLTDCTSFVIMERMGLDSAFTADHHFRQAGFQAMLLNQND
jgi:predicted nucleic acid-binding protein